MNRYTEILISIFFILILTSCNKEPQEIHWGGPKNISMLPLIAENQSFFKKRGLNTIHTEIQTGKLTMDALLNGSLDVGVLVETNISFLYFKPDPKLRVLAIIENKKDDAIMVNTKYIKTTTDLKGKKIGITSGTTSHAYVMHYLQKRNISPDSVTLVNMPPPALQGAFLHGDIPAASVWQPFRYNLIKASKDVAQLQDTLAYTSYCVLVASEEYISSHEEILKKFLLSLMDAEDFVDQNLDNAQSILANDLQMPKEALKEFWNEYDLKVYLSSRLTESLFDQGQWISHYTPEYKGQKVPDFKKAIWTKTLREVDTDRVQE